MFSSFKIDTVIVVATILILKADTRRTSIRENEKPPTRDYRPSKWISNSAMDIWYGNKSAIDIISREFADIMYKLTSRPVRSVLQYSLENANNSYETYQQMPQAKQVSRVDMNFISSDNTTFHTIRLAPMERIVNNTVIKGFEPLLGMD